MSVCSYSFICYCRRSLFFFLVALQELKINRPSKYPGPETPHLNWPDVLARLVLFLFFASARILALYMCSVVGERALGGRSGCLDRSPCMPFVDFCWFCPVVLSCEIGNRGTAEYFPWADEGVKFLGLSSSTGLAACPIHLAQLALPLLFLQTPPTPLTHPNPEPP